MPLISHYTWYRCPLSSLSLFASSSLLLVTYQKSENIKKKKKSLLSVKIFLSILPYNSGAGFDRSQSKGLLIRKGSAPLFL